MAFRDLGRRIVRGLRRRMRALLGRPAPAKPAKRLRVVAEPAVPKSPPRFTKRRRTASRADAPWRLLVLGGSNSVIKGGLIDATVACLSDRLGPPAKLSNRAVGANTSIHGLMLAKRATDLADFDTLVIEYGVNDTPLSRDGMDLWAGAAEGLLRYVLSVRPDMRVVYVLLGKRALSTPDLFRSAEGLVDLVEHYCGSHSVTLVDVDHLLRAVLFPYQRQFASLYRDMSHLDSRRIAPLLGAYVAAEIANAPRRTGGTLPPPLHPWEFSGAALVDLASDRPDRTFANSRFFAATRRIGRGESVTLEVPGRIAALEYVGCAEGATLRVEETGETPFALHTRHKLTAEGRYPFLIRSEPLRGRDWRAGARGPRRVTLSAPRAVPAADVIPAFNMMAAPAGAGEAAYVSTLLCVP